MTRYIGPQLRAANLAFVFTAALAAFAIYWGHTGVNMYPLDDGWSFFSFDQPQFDITALLYGTTRELRLVPYLLAQAIESDGFVALNAILILVNAAIFTGQYVVAFHLLGKRPAPAFIASALAMMFPDDHTSFWLGAFGANVSMLLLIWYAALAFVAIDRDKPWIHWLALGLLFLGIRTYPGYVFLPLILVNGQLILTGGVAGYKRALLPYVAPQFMVFLAGFGITLWGLFFGSTRASHVSSFDPSLVADGYHAALGQLFTGWIDDLWRVHPETWAYGLLFAAIFSMSVVWLSSTSNQPPKHDPLPSGVQFNWGLVAMSVAIILICYLPYSLSDIRFNEGRALTASRFGLALLVVTIGAFLASAFGRKRRVFERALTVLAIAVLSMFCLDKLDIFDRRLHRSTYQKVFLGDLLTTLPCPPAEHTPIVILVPAREFSRDTTGVVLVNRPQLLVRTVYDNERIKIATLTSYMLRRFGTVGPADEVLIRDRPLGKHPLLFEYSFRQGLGYRKQLTLDVGREKTRTTIHGAALPPTECSSTPLARAIVRSHSANLRILGLSRIGRLE